MTASDKPSEEFLNSSVCKAIREIVLTGTNLAFQGQFTDLVDDKQLVAIERLLAAELRKERIEGMEACIVRARGFPGRIVDDLVMDIGDLIAEERAR